MKRVKTWTPLAKRRPALQGVIFGHHQKWGSPCCYCCLIWNLPLRVLLSPSQYPHLVTTVGATACKNPPPPSGHCLPASAGDSGWTDADRGYSTHAECISWRGRRSTPYTYHHSIHIYTHTHASVENEYGVSNMEVEIERRNNTKERQRTNGWNERGHSINQLKWTLYSRLWWRTYCR